MAFWILTGVVTLMLAAMLAMVVLRNRNGTSEPAAAAPAAPASPAPLFAPAPLPAPPAAPPAQAPPPAPPALCLRAPPASVASPLTPL